MAHAARVLTPPPASAFLAVGSGVEILEHAWLSVVEAVGGVVPTLTIGDRTGTGRLCHIARVGEIDVGADVLTAERIFIGDTYHGYEDPLVPVIGQQMAPPEKVTIGRGAFLGLGAVVLRGVTIGEGAYVGAGAVVTGDPRGRWSW